MHATQDGTFVILCGKVRITTHNDGGSVFEDVVLCNKEGRNGVPKANWHAIMAMGQIT